MELTQAAVLVIAMAGCCLLPLSTGVPLQNTYFRKPRLYSPSRYGPGFHSGISRKNDMGLGNTFGGIYDRNRAGGGQTTPVVIRLPSNVINDPNFKMSDLPFYLSSGLFDPNNLPGPLGGGPGLPSPIVDPVNPSGGVLLGGSNNNNFLNGGLNNNNNILGGGLNNNDILGGGLNNNILGGGGGGVVPGGIPGGSSLVGGGSVLGAGGSSLNAGGSNVDFYNPFD